MTVVAALVVAWAVLASAFTVLTLWGTERLAGEIARRSPPSRWPRLVVLRPCEGIEPGLHENLASSLALYAGPRHVLLLVPSQSDPSWAVARAVAAAAPAGSMEVVITGVEGARNRKAAQLAVGLSRVMGGTLSRAGEGTTRRPAPDEQPEIVVQADSDVRFDNQSLPSLVTALLEAPGCGAAFAVPVEPDGRTAGDFASSALLSCSHQDFFALAALTRLSGGVMALAGALAAHRVGDLTATGGFAPLESTLGEDFEVGRRLRACGLSVAVSDRVALCPDEGRRLREVIGRTARWAMVVRRQRGAAMMASYPLLLAPTPLLLALSSLLALLGAPWALVIPVLLCALRALLASRLRTIHLMPVSPLRALALALAGELLILAAFPRALFGDEVVWRGRRLRIMPGGGIEVPSPASRGSR